MYRPAFASPSPRIASARPNRRGGFTLVELMVVIAIIAMLVGLLIPAVMAARNAARRNQCISNQQNLGKAVINYVTMKNKFPPLFSVQPDPTNPTMRTAVGWVPPILPYIEQNPLFQVFQQNRWYGTPGAEIEILVCPSRDPTGSPAPLSYVVNGGVRDYVVTDKPMDYRENGVFFDEFTPTYTAGPPKKTAPIDLSYLNSHDGTKSTLMLTENLSARDWISTMMPPTGYPEPHPLQPGTNGDSWWQAVTWLQPQQPTPDPNFGQPGDALTNVLLKRNSQPLQPGPSDQYTGKPSSNHSGGFMVTTCDGATRFVSEEIAYPVYCQLMAPYNAGAKYRNDGSKLKYPALWHLNSDTMQPLKPLTDADWQ